jgi:hypothetical protein
LAFLFPDDKTHMSMVEIAGTKWVWNFWHNIWFFSWCDVDSMSWHKVVIIHLKKYNSCNVHSICLQTNKKRIYHNAAYSTMEVKGYHQRTF